MTHLRVALVLLGLLALALLGLLALALLGLLAAPAAAADFYEYGTRVLLSPPLVVTGPGSAIWYVEVPAYAAVGQVYVKNCRLRGIDTPMEFDQDITLYQMGANFFHGGYKFLIGDRKAGRTQAFCLRLPYIPLEEEPAP